MRAREEKCSIVERVRLGLEALAVTYRLCHFKKVSIITVGGGRWWRVFYSFVNEKIRPLDQVFCRISLFLEFSKSRKNIFSLVCPNSPGKPQ